MRKASVLLFTLLVGCSPQPTPDRAATPSTPGPEPSSVAVVDERKQVKAQLGRLIMAGFYDYGVNAETVDLLKKQGVGGVFFHSWNVDTRDQVVELTRALRRTAGRPLIVALDQEPGEIARLRGVLPDQPAPLDIAETMTVDQSRAMGSRTGQDLCALGFNLNFAPVLDVLGPPNAFIGERAYGYDSGVVSDHGLAYLEGLQDGGVMGMIKHFPGHGGVPEDSHLELPVDARPESAIRGKDLVPFERAIDSEAHAVMTAHIVMPAFDKRLPASISAKITGQLLRDEMGFDGLVMTDAIEMGAITDTWSVPEASLMALKAGADMIPIWKDLSLVPLTLKRLRQAIDTGELPLARAQEAVRHVEEAMEWAEEHCPVGVSS